LFALFFYRLTINLNSDLELWDEQTNARVIQELIQGEKIFEDLKLNGNHFFEKPPLWYYITGSVISVFGYGNIQLRIVSVLASVGIFALVYFISRQYYSRWRSLANLFFLILINQFFIVNASGYFSSHTLWTADLDSLQFFFLLLGQYYFILSSKTYKQYFVYLSYGAFAFALMTKGILALIPITLISIWYILNRAKFGFTIKHLFTVSLILFAIILPWHLYMYLKFGYQFIDTYFIYHVINRGLLGVESHSEGWYFYSGILINFNIFVLWPFLYWRIYKTIKTKKLSISTKYVIYFSVIYFIIINLMQTKLAWYAMYLWLLLILI
jgi:4-amino-4-deoxy-L-arabinose transferase-like glycosyltransferase